MATFSRTYFKDICLRWRNLVMGDVPRVIVRDLVNDHTDWNLQVLGDTDAGATLILRDLKSADKSTVAALRNALVSAYDNL